MAQQMAQRTQKQHYASQPKNPTATRKRTGYRVMNKTDTHSDILFWYLGQAHNLEVAGSNPAPATMKTRLIDGFFVYRHL